MAPRFWYRDPRAPGFLARILSPLGWMSGQIASQMARRRAQATSPIPVIGVTCPTQPGPDTTPVVIALIEQLLALGHQPHIILRGHSNSGAGVTQILSNDHHVDSNGQSASLLAAFAPVWKCESASRAVNAAADAGATIVIEADSRSQFDLRRDLEFVVIASDTGFGNEKCRPAGPLLEPLDASLTRATAVILIQSGGRPHSGLVRENERSISPCLEASLSPLQTGMAWEGERVIAFASGRGSPGFFSGLKSLRANLIETIILEETLPMSRALATRLLRQARQSRAQLVTTEQDATRLPQDLRRHVLAMPMRLTFVEPEKVREILQSVTRAFPDD